MFSFQRILKWWVSGGILGMSKPKLSGYKSLKLQRYNLNFKITHPFNVLSFVVVAWVNFSLCRLTMPAYPPFAGPFGPMSPQTMFRTSGPGRNGQNASGVSNASARNMPRGFDSRTWPWAATAWGGDGSWAHHQPRGQMSAPWWDNKVLL